jgi:hypothetical protein
VGKKANDGAEEKETGAGGPAAPSPVSVTVNVGDKTKRAAGARARRDEDEEAFTPAPPAAAPQLADDADDDDDAEEFEPLDPVSEYCEQWNDGRTYKVKLTRLPDPPDYEQSFARPCRDEFHFDLFTFRPDALVRDVQNKMRSGGRVRVQLIYAGRVMAGSTQTFFVNDPDTAPAPSPREQAQGEQSPPAPAQPQAKSRLEQLLEDKFYADVSDKLSDKANGAAQGTGLSPEDELTLRLARDTDLWGKVSNNLASVITSSQGGRAEKKTWKDHAVNVVAGNTHLQNRLARVLERVIDKVLPGEDGAGDDDADDGAGDEGAAGEGAAGELAEGPDASVTLMECVIARCAEGAPFSFDEAVARKVRAEMPDVWEEMIRSLASYPVPMVIAWFSDPEKYPAYYGLILKAPHARAWVETYLTIPAQGLVKG